MKFVIAVLMMVAPLAAHGQLLKCISTDGRVEYASDCPPGTKAQQTGIKSSTGGPPPSKAAPAQKSLAEREADFRKRQMERQETQAKDDKKAAELKEKSQICEQAQGYLRGLQAGERIARYDPKTGERAYLEDSARAGEIASAQRQVDQSCK